MKGYSLLEPYTLKGVRTVLGEIYDRKIYFLSPTIMCLAWEQFLECLVVFTIESKK